MERERGKEGGAHQSAGKSTDNPEEGGATEHDDKLPEGVKHNESWAVYGTRSLFHDGPEKEREQRLRGGRERKK